MTGKPVTLFQFSELTGPAKSVSNGGKPVTIEFAPEKKTKNLKRNNCIFINSKHLIFIYLYLKKQIFQLYNFI